MKVTGFSFIKNAIIYDYPIVEAVKSILPICDDFVIAVGKSDDDTLGLVKNIDNTKIRTVDTIWDESLREGGRVLALETDKALDAIDDNTDWAFYIQGDEVVHEKYLPTIYEAMLKYKDDDRVDGLLFKYLHFYGSFDYVGASSNWYKNEIRVIKNNKSVYSYKDAQGFRKAGNQKLNVKTIDASVYHYGWVREPSVMQKKATNFKTFYNDDLWMEQNVVSADKYEYAKHSTELKLFEGDHPEIMKKRIKAKNWKFDVDISIHRKSLKDRGKGFLRKYLGIDTDYRNYKIIK